MLSFTIVLTALLAATFSFAAPLDPMLHSYEKRDAVCGANFRSLVNNDSCLPNKAAFTLTPPSTVTKVTFEGNDVPPKVQCDHTVEIQLLDRVASKSGLCELIAALTAADPKLKKADLLASASDNISKIANLNFLDGSVNNRKKTVIQRSLGSPSQQRTDLDKAVASYLDQVKDASRGVASTLDKDIADIKAKAVSVLAKLPDGKGGRDKVTATKNKLKTALADFKSANTVLAAWNKVLSDAETITQE
ncbi:hypothetical protein BDW22DRAFT_1432186 [Trametopsis cervina]|nr:hypothetical protein BDW22DRAFT_1432186 [Trametopsis cervina]